MTEIEFLIIRRRGIDECSEKYYLRAINPKNCDSSYKISASSRAKMQNF